MAERVVVADAPRSMDAPVRDAPVTVTSAAEPSLPAAVSLACRTIAPLTVSVGMPFWPQLDGLRNACSDIDMSPNRVV